jgi:hypothetical protein
MLLAPLAESAASLLTLHDMKHSTSSTSSSFTHYVIKAFSQQAKVQRDTHITM